MLCWEPGEKAAFSFCLDRQLIPSVEPHSLLFDIIAGKQAGSIQRNVLSNGNDPSPVPLLIDYVVSIDFTTTG